MAAHSLTTRTSRLRAALHALLWAATLAVTTGCTRETPDAQPPTDQPVVGDVGDGGAAGEEAPPFESPAPAPAPAAETPPPDGDPWDSPSAADAQASATPDLFAEVNAKTSQPTSAAPPRAEASSPPTPGVEGAPDPFEEVLRRNAFGDQANEASTSAATAPPQADPVPPSPADGQPSDRLPFGEPTDEVATPENAEPAAKAPSAVGEADESAELLDNLWGAPNAPEESLPAEDAGPSDEATSLESAPDPSWPPPAAPTPESIAPPPTDEAPAEDADAAAPSIAEESVTSDDSPTLAVTDESPDESAEESPLPAPIAVARATPTPTPSPLPAVAPAADAPPRRRASLATARDAPLPAVPVLRFNTRHMAWLLGGKLALAELAELDGATPSEVAAWRDEVARLANSLKVAPPRPLARAEDVAGRVSAAMRAAASTGDALRAAYGPDHAALLEIALKTNALLVVARDRPDLAKPVATAVRDAADRADLPGFVWEDSVVVLEGSPTPEDTHNAVVRLHQRVESFLR